MSTPPKSAAQIAREAAQGLDAWHLRRTISEMERIYEGVKRAEVNGVQIINPQGDED
jgi:hypothetical protein